MRNLIIQCYIGHMESYAKKSSDYFKKYAEIHGSDYELHQELYEFEDTPDHEEYFQWMRVIYDEKYDEYDDILCVDNDISILDYDNNIFKNKIKGCEIHAVIDSEINQYFKYKYINTGMLLMSKEFRIYVRNNFISPKQFQVNLINNLKEIEDYTFLPKVYFTLDEYYLNKEIQRLKCNIKYKDYKWNTLYSNKQNVKNVVFLHYLSVHKKFFV